MIARMVAWARRKFRAGPSTEVLEEIAVRLWGISALFQIAHRFGAETDEPEGARWVQLSDSLACQLQEELKIMATQLVGKS
jgi:hypothetical protein